MNTPPLNLLRYPRRAYLSDAVPWRAAVLALAAGILMGGGWGLWQQSQYEALQTQRSQWQAQTRAWRSQQAQQRDRQQLLSRWDQRQHAWQARRAQQMQLHAALAAQADTAGLRVERWQGDGRQLVLQAWLPRAEAVPGVLAALSRAWPPGWTLHSLSDRSGAGVEVVLQAEPLAGSHGGEPQKP